MTTFPGDLVQFWVLAWVIAIPVLIVGFAMLAVFRPTAWELGPSEITLRALSLLYIPIRVRWDDIEWICIGTSIIGWTALKLDGGHLFREHVAIRTTRGFSGRIRFTPADVHAFKAAVSTLLDIDPAWERTSWGWLRRGRLGPFDA